MCKRPKLELEFEIVTLSHNIEKLKKLGVRTAELQDRLEFCRAEFNSCLLEEDGFSFDHGQTHRNLNVEARNI
jgi:hypothetical protein